MVGMVFRVRLLFSISIRGGVWAEIFLNNELLK